MHHYTTQNLVVVVAVVVIVVVVVVVVVVIVVVVAVAVVVVVCSSNSRSSSRTSSSSSSSSNRRYRRQPQKQFLKIFLSLTRANAQHTMREWIFRWLGSICRSEFLDSVYMGITVVDTHADHASGTSIPNIQCTTFGGLCSNRGWCPPKTMRSLGASLPNVLAVCIYL